MHDVCCLKSITKAEAEALGVFESDDRFTHYQLGEWDFFIRSCVHVDINHKTHTSLGKVSKKIKKKLVEFSTKGPPQVRMGRFSTKKKIKK